MSKASMARAIAKAGKKQEVQTRGLTGNRNEQGDFVPEVDYYKDMPTEFAYHPDGNLYVDFLNEAELAKYPTKDLQLIKRDLDKTKKELEEILELDRKGIEQAHPDTLDDLTRIENALEIIEGRLNPN